MFSIPFSVIEGAIVYANLLTLLCLGLTITYITTKVPNFAQGSFAIVGSYIAWTLFHVYRLHPYLSIPIAFIIGGIVGLLIYVIVLRPLVHKGASSVILMISTLGIDLILVGIFGAYADYISRVTHEIATRFVFTYLDFNIGFIPAILPISCITIIILLISLLLLLYKTKFGIALRASVENPFLAETLGINTERVRLFSWFLSGALAGVAGCLLPFKQEIYPATGSLILPSVFAASIVGGFESIYGALVGAYLIGFSETLITYGLSILFGTQMLVYSKAVSLTALIITLIVAPQGLMGVNWRKIFEKIPRRKIV